MIITRNIFSFYTILLIVISNFFSAMGYSDDFRQRIALDPWHGEICFLLDKFDHANYAVNNLLQNGSSIQLEAAQTHTIHYQGDGVIPHQFGKDDIVFWRKKFAFFLSRQNLPFKLRWNLTYEKRSRPFFMSTSSVFSENDNETETMNILQDIVRDKKTFSATIIKHGRISDFSYSLFLVNALSKNVSLPTFFSEGNILKLKFPSGKMYEHPVSAKGEKISLKPGESKVIKIDLEELLKESKEFSMKDFEYGLTELVWEVKLDDGKVLTRNFWLVKFNGELPKDNGNGYKLDGPLSLETFRDNKISVLPPARADLPKKEPSKKSDKSAESEKRLSAPSTP